ncbi:MAG: DsbC family protein [Gammaproteobacteria bacterium]|nr:DsbC family protein [Gammaproteobacteria bacterium]MDH4252998.1 DsbC family protein [Gammaproteobacteria bacterium]MDH5308580.1 DsbC family protein [Gammaproteobacteria bacterium]
MRNQTLILIAAAAMLGFTTTVIADDKADELQRVQDRVSSLFSEITAADVVPSPIDGWYVIRKGAIVAYISGDGRYLMQGDLIDLDAQVNLTETSRNESRRELMNSYPAEQMIVFTPAEKRYSVSVFTDIDCTFCRRLHSQIDEYLAAGIEVRYLLYPRSGPASPSWTKAEEVWCADNRNEALTLAKLDKSFETHSCNSSVITTHYSMGQDVGLRGTPAIVLEDGSLISGYLPPPQLAEALAATAQ